MVQFQKPAPFEAIDQDGLWNTRFTFDIMVRSGRESPYMRDVELSKHWKMVASVVDIGGDNDQSLAGEPFTDSFIQRL